MCPRAPAPAPRSDAPRPLPAATQNPRGLHENIAWKDFCEDVGDAVDTTNGKAAALAASRGMVLDGMYL